MKQSDLRKEAESKLNKIVINTMDIQDEVFGRSPEDSKIIQISDGDLE